MTESLDSMLKNSWTVEDVIWARPCGWDGEDDGRNYCRARLLRLFNGRDRLSMKDILDLPIPFGDKVWAAKQLTNVDWADLLLPHLLRKCCGPPNLVEKWIEERERIVLDEICRASFKNGKYPMATIMGIWLCGTTATSPSMTALHTAHDVFGVEQTIKLMLGEPK